MIRVCELELTPYESEEKLSALAAARLKIDRRKIKELSIFKRSVDARKKNDVKIKYTVDVTVDGDENSVLRKCGDKKAQIVTPHVWVQRPKIKTEKRPVVVGAGPAGMFAALTLAKAGCEPIILERGKKVDERKRDVDNFFSGGKLEPSSNVQFGEGGAGTFSDGKLTTGTKNPLIPYVLDCFVQAGAAPEIKYQAKPHIGTDVLMKVVKNLREMIISEGGEFFFGTKMTDLEIKDGKIAGVYTDNDMYFETDTVVLAIGHSARDTFEMLYKKHFNMTAKPFSVGVRIEHPQEFIDRCQYGRFAGAPLLGAADYKLAVHLPDSRGVYTFCMCPGGTVVAAASEEGGICTNGMSCFARNAKNANSAVLVGVSPEDFKSEHPLAGVHFQREIEQRAFKLTGSYKAPAQLVGDFLSRRASKRCGNVEPSYRPGVVMTDIGGCLPDFVTNSLREGIKLMDRKIHGFAMDDAVMTAPETRSSSPVRILRDEQLTGSVQGFYPCGEGAGYAGGITSAAVDGIRCAEMIIGRHRDN